MNEINALTKEQIESLAKEKFGENYSLTSNSDESFTLVKQKTKTLADFGFDINFFVLKNQTGEILLEDFLKSGSVEWENAHTIKAIKREVDSEHSEKRIITTYSFDVLKLKRIHID